MHRVSNGNGHHHHSSSGYVSSNGGRSISPISDESLPISDGGGNGLHDMLTQENLTLRDRVAELERKLQEQEDELILLRSSMADVLRRLSILENQPRENASSGGGAPLLPKYMSKSSSNLRTQGTMGNPHNNEPGYMQRTRRPISPSPKRTPPSTLAMHNGGDHAPIGGATPRRPTPTRSFNQQPQFSSPSPSVMSLSSPIGRSSSTSNIRKGESPIIDGASPGAVAKVSVLPSPVGNGIIAVSSPSIRGFTSLANMSLFGSLRSMNQSLYKNGRDALYSQEEDCLKIFPRGKSINLYGPSNLHSVDVYHTQPAPKEKLKLDWVYGYRGRDCRSNIHSLPTGEIVYFVANIVVLYNADEQMQRHYSGHTDDVKCIAIHPNRLIVATGQAAKHGGLKSKKTCNRGEMESLLEEGENLPHVRIWDSVSLQTLHILGIGDFERAISCITFSKTDGGGLLAVVDESYDHTLSVWDWQRKHRITETKSASDQVLACEFHPTEKNSLITCGKGHINFWTFDGVTLQRKVGLFEGRDKAPKYILCLAFTENGYVLTGDSNGSILMWNNASSRIVKQVPKVHEGGVFSLCALKAGKLISGGGKDGKLLEWDAELKQTSNNVELAEDVGPVRTITCGKGNMLIVGTTHNYILQGTMQFKFSTIMQGHIDEIWGLCAHPVQQQFLTCGYDKMLRLWDSQSKSVVWKKEIADPARCACFHPFGHAVAIGTTVGRWIIIDMSTRDVIAANKDGTEIISCLEYSSDGTHLAIGSHDGGIYIHSVSEDGRRYNRICRCTAHTGSVSHLDWSSDSQYLRSNSGNLEIFYWRPMTAKLVQDMDDIRDLDWATDRCTLSFNTAGLWPENSDGSEVNACDRNKSKSLIASGGACSGEVKLYQFPCVHPKASSFNALGHSSQVTDVRFLQNETRVISIGGKDCSIMQWEVV